MSEPLLERVARAMYARWCSQRGSPDTWDVIPPSHQARWLESARAALDTVLAAMREPSERMLGAGYGWTGIDGKARDIWDAMLSAFEEENGLCPEK